MTHDARALAADLLAGRSAPNSTRLDDRASADLRAIESAGLDADRVLAAALGAFDPAVALNEMSHLCGRDDAAALFDATILPDLALLCGSSPWAARLAGDALSDVFRVPPTHRMCAGLLRAADPMRASQEFGVRAGSLAVWRGLLTARAALFDLRGEGDDWETLAGYSAPAEVCAAWALAQCWNRVRAQRGTLRSAKGRPLGFVVMGMGKLGGDELNASSDIDLIYIYESDEGRSELGVEAADWFGELARALTDALGASGAGFRVDMRLRPGGGAGPLACSLAAAEAHYESFGQAWERQMLIRSRAIAGSRPLGRRFVESLRPFVYRRRMDPRALSEIRRVKRRLDAEVAIAAGGDENVKLSRGGIRELEYVVQTYQLLYGGRHDDLQTPSTRRALDVLGARDLLPAGDLTALDTAYRFFRRLENRIQIFDGRQNHRLPPEGPQRDALARALGVDSAPEMILLYNGHRRRVLEVFEALFAPVDELLGAPVADPAATLLVGSLRNASVPQLAATGIPDPEEAFEIFRRVLASPEMRSASGGAMLLESLATALCKTAAQCPDPMGALRSFERYLSGQNALGTLLGMLVDDESMTRVFLGLLGRGSYLADLLIHNPAALVPLFLAQDVSGGPAQVESALIEATAAKANPAEALDELRRAKTTLELQIALEEIYHADEPERAWALIVGLARGAVRAVLSASAASMSLEADRLGVLFMGSVGNGEPVMNSDLDMVFVHGGMETASDATRLAQRLIRELEAKSPAGLLFRTDLRLRPFGNQGVLVTSMPAAEKFYREAAPVTTRLALLRTEAVSGAPAALFMERWPSLVFEPGLSETESRELVDIRRRIAEQVPQGRRDVKNTPGTLSDIEFVAGSLQLRHGAENDVLRARNTRRALDALASAGLLDGDEARTFSASYRWYKRLSSHLRVLYPRPVSLLPDNDREGAILARMMGLKSFAELCDRFDEASRTVSALVHRRFGH